VPKPNDHDSTSSGTGVSRVIALAATAAAGFFVLAGLIETALIKILRPTELTLDWISDVVLSSALFVAVYLWLHLRATREALSARERSQVAIEAQLSLAESMQRRLLPAVPAPADGFEWAAVLKPAGSIGGDFFDFRDPRPGVRLMLMADVSGKGISAAMALTLLRAAFHNLARSTDRPAELASRMSAAFHDEWQGSPYVTAVVARVDAQTRTLTYTNAGHPSGLLLRADEDRALGEGGPPLGLLKGAPYVEQQIDLAAGDVCVFVTDGISEAVDDGVRSWRQTARDSFRGNGTSSAADVSNAILAAAERGRGPDGVEDWADDRTVVVLSVTDASPSPRS